MVLDDNSTMIETEKWEDIRRKLYHPCDTDEYRSSSKPLTGVPSITCIVMAVTSCVIFFDQISHSLSCQKCYQIRTNL